MPSQRGDLYAIVRIDPPEDPRVLHWNAIVSVKAVTEDQDFAFSEVERLNTLNGHLGCKYMATPTRWARR